MNEELLNHLYTKYKLSSIGDFNTFKNDMQNENVARAFYDKYKLSSTGDFNTFKSDLGLTQLSNRSSVPTSFQDPNRESKDKGYRNNNPLNLKHTSKNEFRVFNNLEEGYRASENDLSRKLSGKSPALNNRLKQQGKNWDQATVADVILTWAPPSDNSREALNNYLNSVSTDLGIDIFKTHPSQVNARDLTIAMSKIESPDSYKALQQYQKSVPRQQPGTQNISLDQELTTRSTELANKKINEQYSKMGTTDKLYTTFARKGIWGSITDMFDGNGFGAKTATPEEINAAKLDLISTDPKYKELWINSEEGLDKLLGGDGYKSSKDHLDIANRLEKNLKEDIATDSGFFDALDSHAYKTENGVQMVNLKPFGAGLVGEADDLWYPIDEVKKMTTHPLATSSKTTAVKRFLNEKVNSVQADLAKAERYRVDNIVNKGNNYRNALEKSLISLEKQLSTIYPKGKDGKMVVDPNDPLFRQYEREAELYNQSIEKLKQYDPDVKVATLFDQNRKARIFALDDDYKNLNLGEKLANGLLYLTKDATSKLSNIPRSIGQFIGGGIDAAAGTDLATTSQISDAYNDNILTPSSSSKAVRKTFELPDGRKLEYSPQGELIGLLDNNDYSIDISKEDLAKIASNNKASYEKASLDANFGGVGSGISDLLSDLPVMAVGSGWVAKALGGLGKSGLAAKYTGIGRLANGLANSDRMRTFSGSYAAFYDKITEGAIKEGGLTSASQIFGSGFLKTGLESVIESVNSIEGKILSGKVWDSLSTAQVKKFTERVLAGEAIDGVLREIVDTAKDSFKGIRAKNVGSTLFDTGVQGIAESLEEVGAAILEPELVNRILNNWLDTSYNTNANLEEISEGALVGFAGGFLLGGLGAAVGSYSSNTKDAILNNSIRASLQHKDLFKSTVSDLFEAKKAEITQQYQNQPEELTKNLDTLQKAYNKVLKTHQDASSILDSRSIFKESDVDGFIPSKAMQTAYSEAALIKAILNSVNTDEVVGLDRYVKKVDRQLEDLDLFKKHRYNGYVNIESVNNKLKKEDKIDDKLLDELYPQLQETVEKQITKLAKSNLDEASKISMINAEIGLEISKLKNGTASEELQKKYNETKERLKKEEDDRKKKEEEIKDRKLLNDSYKDFITDKNLTAQQIADKYEVPLDKATDILTKVNNKHIAIKTGKYKEVYDKKVKKLTNNPDILTEQDIQMIITGMDNDSDPNLSNDDINEIYELVSAKLNNTEDSAMVEALTKVRDFASENFFKKSIETNPDIKEYIGIGKYTLARVPGQNEFRIVNPGKNYGKKATKNEQILAKALFTNAVASTGRHPLLYISKVGKKNTILYTYDFNENSWAKLIEHPILGDATEFVTPAPKTEKKYKNALQKNFDELYEQGVIDFTGEEFIAALEEILATKVKPAAKVTPTKKSDKDEKDDNEEAQIEYIQDKLNDSLTDASLDPNLDENKNYNTKRTLDFIIKSINTNSLLYEEHKDDPVVKEIEEIIKGMNQEVVDSNPIDQIYAILTDTTKNSEFINTIYNFVKQSQDNAEAKFNWTNNIAKVNNITDGRVLKTWLQDNVDVNYNIDLDYIRINFSAEDATIVDNNLIKFNPSKIGELPVNLIYTDKTTGIKYFSFMHDSSYFNQTSRFDDNANAVASASLEEYGKTKRGLISALNIVPTLFDSYILDNQLDKIPSELLPEVNLFINQYYIKTHSGKNIINITPEDFEDVIKKLKEEIYQNKDNIDNLKSTVLDISSGHFEHYQDDTTTKTSELSSDQGNTIHSIEVIKKESDPRGTPGSVIANVVSPNLSLNHIYLTTDEYTPDEVAALKDLLKSFLDADQNEREQIRKLAKLFIYDNEKGNNSIKLVVDANGGKPFIKVKVNGREAELNTNAKNPMNEKADAILDSYFKHNPNKFVSDIYLTKEKDAWKSDFPKLMLGKKVIFSTDDYASYEEYVKSITNTDAVSLDIYQSNIKYRATPTVAKEEPKVDTQLKPSTTVKVTFEEALEDSEFSSTRIGDTKIISNEVIEGDIEWLNEILPQLGAPKQLIDDITSDVEVLAAFVSSMEILDDFGKNYGIYYSNKTKLNSNRSQIRHEAFEAIYALYLTDDEKKPLLEAAKKRFNAPAKQDLEILSKLHPTLSKKELVDKWYKEELADAFNEYVYKEPTNIIEKFFNKIKDLINNLLGRKDVINSLFNNINAGKYKNKPVNKKFVKNVKEYSSVANKNVTDETARKIGKSLAAMMLTATNKTTGKYVFIDMDNVTYNNIPIIKEKVYNTNTISGLYVSRSNDYISKLQNPSEKEMYKSLVELHLKDFQTDKLIYNATIAEFNKLLKIKNKNPENDIDDFYDENEEESEGRDGKQYDVSAYETDYKSNQYPVIKLLFSSIMNPDGNMIIGPEAPIVQNVPYEVVNNLLILLFADKYSGSIDIDDMIKDIEEFTQYRPEFKQIHSKLVDWKDKGYTHLLHQFANSVVYEKFNFLNIIKDDKVTTEVSEYDLPEDASSTTTTTTASIIQQISKDPVDTLEDRWERNISNLFVKYDMNKTPIVQTVNKKEATAKLENLQKLINNNSNFSLAFRSTTDDMYMSIGLGLREIFNKLGINFNMKAAKIYFKNHGTGDSRRDLEVIKESLNLLVEDTTKTDESLKRDLMSFVDPARNKKFEDDFGELKFQINENVIRNLIKSQLIFEDQILENTILSGSVRKWVYGLPSFLNQQLLLLQNNKDELYNLSDKLYHKRSLILNAMKTGFKPTLSDLDNLSIGDEDINLADPRLVEDLYASIQVTLSTNNRASGTPANVRLLSFNSHKRNNVFITIPKFYSFRTNKSAINNDAVNVFRGYFLDEYERILAAVNSNNTMFKAFKNLSKNSYSSNLFPELSYNYKGKVSKQLEKLRSSLYSTDNLDKDNNVFLNNTSVKDILSEYIEDKLIEVVNKQKQKFADITMPLRSEKVDYMKNEGLELLFPPNILAKYETSTEKAIDNAIADFVIMGMIGSIEHTKVFIGDPAQYKGLVDLSKRTHSTTSSGMQYTLPFDTNYAVIRTDKKTSQYYNDKYQQEILFDVRKREWETYKNNGDIDEVPSDDDIREEVQYIYKDVKKLNQDGEPESRAYGDVDDTDGFAEVTLPMWREMLNSIGRWNSAIHDPIYEKLLKGEANLNETTQKDNTKKGITEILSSLQPVKSVQFGTSLLNNEFLAMSTYHKWALVPSHPGAFIQGSDRQKRYNLAVYGKLDVDYKNDEPLELSKQTHFYLYDSATKSINDTTKYVPSVIKDTDDIDAVWNNNTQQIPSWTMKLQNDLSAKFYKKPKVQEGSQFRKNVFQNLQLDEPYVMPESDEIKTGKELLSEMQDIDSSISNRKLDKFMKDIDYDTEKGVIGNKKQFTDFMLGELERRTPTDNLLNYLKNNEFNINLLPQFKNLFENIYSSINRNRIIKSEVTGGSFVEIPETGLTGAMLADADTDISKLNTGNIILLNGFSIGKNGKLKGPTFEKNTETGELKYSPSLVFLPHHFVRQLPKHQQNAEFLNKMFKDNPKLLRGLGYRIPNQGASSIDSFQIAGILPEYMGDSIVVYQDITTKYGSDYDIDKMYVSLYNFKYSKGKLTTIPYYSNPTEEQNLELYDERISEMLKNNKEYKKILQEIKQGNRDAANLVEKLDGNKNLAEDNELKQAILNEIYDYLNDNTDDENVGDSLFENYIDIDTLNDIKSKVDDLLVAKKQLIENLKKEYSIDKFNQLSVYEKHSEKALQNRKMDIYRSVVESEFYHFENISPLDKWTEPIKKAIKNLYNKEEGEDNDPVNYSRDLEFFTTYDQLRIKNINNNAKKALAIAANSGVALPFQRQAGMKYFLNIGRGKHEIDFTEIFDIDGKLKSQRISAGYLSAFVDADKDPYIIFANINTFTYPIVDTLIRAGATEQQIITFMSQPVIKEVLFMQNFESPLFPVKEKLKTSIEKVADKYVGALEADQSFNITGNNDFSGLFDKYIWKSTDGTRINKKLKDNVYAVNVQNKENQLSALENLEILYLFNQLKLHSSNIANAITSAKYTVSAGGATFNESLVKYEATRKSLGATTELMSRFVGSLQNNTVTDKLIKEINSFSPVHNYVKLFVKKTDDGYRPTSEGTYFLNSAVLLKDFSKGDNITQHPLVSNAIYDIHNKLGKPYIGDPKVVNKIKNSAYTFLINRSLMSRPLVINGKEYTITPDLIENLFKIKLNSETSQPILTRIFNDDFREIAPTLVDVLIPKKVFKANKSLSFVRGDNFKTSDITIKNQIIKEVEAVIEADRKRNTNPSTKKETRNDSLALLLYSFYSSGFTFDSSSFFDLLPIELTEKLIDVSNLYSHLDSFGTEFIDHFFRSMYHDKDFIHVVTKNPYNANMGVATVLQSGRLITGYNGDEYTYKPYLSFYNKDKRDYDLYKFHGKYTTQREGVTQTKIVYAPIPKLGYKAGRFKITELGTTKSSWLNPDIKSSIKGLPKTFRTIDNQPTAEYLKEINTIDINSLPKNAIKVVPLQKNKEMEVVPTTTSKTGFKLPVDKKGKDQGKADLSNSFIGYGYDLKSPNQKDNTSLSSTTRYALAAYNQNIPVNNQIKADENTIAFVSVNGNNKATDRAIEDTILAAREIIEVGGIVIMDSTFDASRPWNTSGEALVQEQIGEPTGQTSKGYNYWGKDPENKSNDNTQTMEFTPETITSLKPNEIFVFGSNEGSSKGGPQTHGKGAALDAKKYFGAIQGQARGLQGQSYAVVTKKYWDVEKSSTLDEIYEELSTMLTFAKSNSDKRFLVTKVGSSLAGYTVNQIKELFEKLNTVQGISDNVILPKEYEVRSKNNPEGLLPIDRSSKKCKE